LKISSLPKNEIISASSEFSLTGFHRYSFGCTRRLHPCDKCGSLAERSDLIMLPSGLLQHNDKTGCGLIRDMKDITPVTLNIESKSLDTE
jgi:hypothetical protein